MSSNVTEPYVTETYVTETDDDYTWMTNEFQSNYDFQNSIRMLYVPAYLIICILGPSLNSYVIAAGCRLYPKIKKSATAVWVLALAVTHLVYSVFLVLQFLYAWHHFNWQYSAALCKMSSYITYFSMFSTAAMLSLWNLSSSRCFQGCLGSDKGRLWVLLLVLGSWTFGTVVSSPSLFSRELRSTKLGLQCIDDYDLNKEKTTDDGMKKLTAVVLSRFLLGVLVPMFVIFVSACLACQQDHNEDVNEEEKCRRVTCAISVAYLVCWTPLLTASLIQAKIGNLDSFKYGLPAATVLASAHCFINPVIYLLVGRMINMKWMLPDKTQDTPL